jgi:hypothetical protein
MELVLLVGTRIVIYGTILLAVVTVTSINTYSFTVRRLLR